MKLWNLSVGEMVVKVCQGFVQSKSVTIITMAVQKEEGQVFKVRIRGKAHKTDILMSVIVHPTRMKRQMNCSISCWLIFHETETQHNREKIAQEIPGVCGRELLTYLITEPH